MMDLVNLVGIEPTTSSMPWKRAPSCATGPLRVELRRGPDGQRLFNSRPPVRDSQTSKPTNRGAEVVDHIDCVLPLPAKFSILKRYRMRRSPIRAMSLAVLPLVALCAAAQETAAPAPSSAQDVVVPASQNAALAQPPVAY